MASWEALGVFAKRQVGSVDVAGARVDELDGGDGDGRGRKGEWMTCRLDALANSSQDQRPGERQFRWNDPCLHLLFHPTGGFRLSSSRHRRLTYCRRLCILNV